MLLTESPPKTAPTVPPPPWVPALFVASIFLGSLLLFLVQPLSARMLLPQFGGSPAVWNTALVFYQTLLLFGYLYAHGLARIAKPRLQKLVHVPLLLLPLLLLPPVVPAELVPVPGRWPGFQVLTTLAVLIGAPFFVLSTNSSLIQHWWAVSHPTGSRDPYWLYAASNVGSLLALLSYPFLVEPAFDLESQARLWSAAYAFFVALTVGSMWIAHRREGSVTRTSPLAEGEPPVRSRDRAPTHGRRALWVVRSAVGTGLLLSVTMRITTDVASVPLFWVLPLALYLLTFIVAFGATDRLPRSHVAAGAVVGTAAAAGTLLTPWGGSFLSVAALNLAALFFGALLCHRDLAADRPAPAHLTGFYLWISFGGALGGILSSLVAPLLFDSVLEYPLSLLAVAVLLYLDPAKGRLSAYRPSWGVAIAAAAFMALPTALRAFGASGVAPWLALAGFAAVWGLVLRRYVGFVLLSVVAIALAHAVGGAGASSTLAQERSFFGVIRVQAYGDTVKMVHGTTVHGAQIRNPEPQLTPPGYYHPSSPLGSAVLGQPSEARIGVVGLGAGALAGLLRPGQSLVYHEIDPLVVEMAHAYFTYLDRSAGAVSAVLGDGRLTLRDVADGAYDLLIVDAFSSDFVPTHLLTVEALQLYRAKVRSGGLVLLHIPNRHADLRRVMKGYAELTGERVLYRDYEPSREAQSEGAIRSQVAAIAPLGGTLDALRGLPDWTPLRAEIEAVVWTDARIDLPAVLR